MNDTQESLLPTTNSMNEGTDGGQPRPLPTAGDPAGEQAGKLGHTSAAYDGKSIRVLEGLEAVRKSPGMYIGDTGIHGFHHCASEIIDNSVDEAMAGHCDRIDVTLHADGSLSVRDNGRGIPVDPHPSNGVATATVVMTVLSAGGKFDNEGQASAYKTSGGLHGVGASVVNALSSKFKMTIERDGGRWEQTFTNGGRPAAPLERTGNTRGVHVHGTEIRFWLDRGIFRVEEGEPTPQFEHERLATALSTRAHLNPGLTIAFTDEARQSAQEWKASGFQEILDVMSPEKSPPVLRTLCASETVETKAGKVEVMIALRVHDQRASRVLSFANNINTPQGGTHESGFRAAMLRAFNRYGTENKLLKDDLTAGDVAEGLVAAVSVRMTERPRFSGQTKERLANTEPGGAVNGVTYRLLNTFFEEHPKEAKVAIARADRAARARVAADKARSTVERQTPLSIGTLPGKLADCQETDPERCELFLVEGDSAGGSAKMGRDRRYQAILPLKGKPLNVQRHESVTRGLESEEIQNIVRVLGCGAGPAFDMAKLKYGKLIILADADVDGSHIQTLLLTLQHRYMPELLSSGRVYLAMPPLFRVSKGKGAPIYLRDQEALDAHLAEHGASGWDVSRFKGLGEMNPEQLWDTTMNPATRILQQIRYQDPADPARDEDIFELLMGPEVPPRREFIERHAGYGRVISC